MRVKFIVSEALLGLRRNLTMTIAMIVTTAIALGLFGAGVIVQQRVEDMKDYYYYKVEVSVFLADDVTPEQRGAIGTSLEENELVKEVIYESKEEAYSRFQEQFKDSPDLVDNVRPQALPESYRVKLNDPEQFVVVASAVEGMPGVDQVVDQREILDRLFGVLNGFRDAAIVVAVVQAVAALLLIANTVQVAVFSRRREIGVMRLVGASRWYVQVPFLLEAAIAGLLGAGIAVLGLWGVKVVLVDDRLAGLFSSGVIPRITTDHILAVAPLLTGLGVGMASLAALITVARYVRY
jgi:cell division transport system permease protein